MHNKKVDKSLYDERKYYEAGTKQHMNDFLDFIIIDF